MIFTNCDENLIQCLTYLKVYYSYPFRRKVFNLVDFLNRQYRLYFIPDIVIEYSTHSYV